MTDSQIEYIRNHTTWKSLVLTFTKLYEQGRVEKSDWTTWCKVWSERNPTATTSLSQDALSVFGAPVDNESAPVV